MRWKFYRERLTTKAQRPLPAVSGPTGLSAAQHALVLRSLRKFQLGEAGEGRVANEIDHVPWARREEDLKALVKLWVKEEGRHARVLGLMVKAMGGRVLTRHWSTGGFTWLRRALGVRFKLLVALAAEVAGICFYGSLATALPAGDMKGALEELGADEQDHLEFQAELFGSFSHGVAAHALVQSAWALGMLAVAGLVTWEHGATLCALGVSRGEMFRRLMSGLVEVSTKIARARTANLPSTELVTAS